MKLIWQEPAKKGRREVAAYIRREFGIKRAKQFRQEVEDTTSRLMSSPYIGKIEPLYAGRPKTYRSVIVNGLNKLVYFVEDNTIVIAAFWDTRREPTSQAAQTE